MFDFMLFGLPLIPLLWAVCEDFTSKKGEFWIGWIYISVLLAAFWKILVYPETLLISVGFCCFTMSIGLYLQHQKAWSEGDALFYGILGFILPTIDITFFVLSGVVCLILAMFFDKLILERWGREKFHWKSGSSHALWVIALIYLVYWGVTVL